jgi:hypothetical protein
MFAYLERVRPMNEVQVDVVQPEVREGPSASGHHHVRGMVRVPQLEHHKLLLSFIGVDYVAIVRYSKFKLYFYLM